MSKAAQRRGGLLTVGLSAAFSFCAAADWARAADFSGVVVSCAGDGWGQAGMEPVVWGGQTGQPAQAGPGLHRRPSGASDSEAGSDIAPTVATGQTALLGDAAGLYRLAQGDGWPQVTVDVDFNDGRLHGALLAQEGPEGVAAIPFRFARTHVDGRAIRWWTRTVHGESWSFTGRVERGVAPTPDVKGYCLMAGTLTRHLADGSTVSRNVGLEREPGEP